MKNNFSKYLILMLVALFFASTNELSAKEAEHNYESESHFFIDSGNYSLNIPCGNFQKDLTKTFYDFSFANSQIYYNNCYNLLTKFSSLFAPLPAAKDRYLDISVLRI